MMASGRIEAAFQDLHIQIKYEDGDSKDFFISQEYLEMTVFKVKQTIMTLMERNEVPPEYMALFILIGWNEPAQRGNEEIEMEDHLLLKCYFNDISRSNLIKIGKRSKTWTNVMQYYKRKFKEKRLFVLLTTGATFVIGTGLWIASN